MIQVYKPFLSKYKNSAIDAINSEWVSNHGIYVELSTNLLKNIFNIKYCILMNNGTSSTHALFKALKFKYPQIKKIYVPNNVFVSPWNCCLMEYDTSHIEVMKMNEYTFNIDVSEEYINSLDKYSAVLIVHNLGNIVNVPRLKKIRPDLVFLEDNCEGIFGKYDKIYSGTSKCSLCSSVSFYGNKTITTGEGGAFFTNDIDLYKYMKTYYSHGMSDIRYIHNMEGTNYRMTNIQAALLYEQLNDIDTIINMKKNVYYYYKSLYENLSEEYKNIFFLLREEENTEHSKWMFSILTHNFDYDKLEKYMNEKNIQIRPLFYDIHSHLHLFDIKNNFNKIKLNGFMLPSYPELTKIQQEYIFNCLTEYCILNKILDKYI
jgi:perosamine synthetase